MLFLYTVAEMETHGLVPLAEITDGASAGAEDLREVAVELLSRLQRRALTVGKRIPLHMLARTIIGSRSCNLEPATWSHRSRSSDAERLGRAVPVTCPECGRATKMRLNTGRLNGHMTTSEEWCIAAGREISTPRTDPDAYPPLPAPRPTAGGGRIVRVDPTPRAVPTIPLAHRSMGLPARSWLRFG
ncbi:hypothetical protein [Prescottella subtropica]|uniref:hypothetical protein n=1 Tax=Prescottella subtropica TaxID=2545757 RepID=UPI0010F519D9|nr:hypothetical protein [Prescottella subtropica]